MDKTFSMLPRHFGGNEWGLDETAERLIKAREIQPLIIVGIYNTGYERVGRIHACKRQARPRWTRARLRQTDCQRVEAV